MAKTKDTRVKVPAKFPAGETLSQNSGNNDVGTLNPTGRVATDGGGSRGARFLRCKNTVNVATMNTRTLRRPHKQIELCALAKKYKIDVIGIQEHRIVHTDNSQLQYENLPEGYQLITASASRNRVGAAVGGVGFLLSPSAKKAMLSARYITPRILQTTFGGNPKTTILVVYAPTNVSDEKESKEFYHHLAVATKSVPAHNVLIVTGDFNARIGLDNANFAYHDTTNRNGDLLLEYVQENDFVITNTTFQKRSSKLWTCELPSGTRVQLDYVLIRRKWKNSITNTEAYNSFASIGSDHRIVTTKVRLSLRANNKSPPKKVKYDWTKLATDPELQDRYTLEVRNRYALLSEEKCEDQSERYECLIQANKEAAEKVMPKVPKKQRKALCYDSKVEEARKHLREVHKRHVQENTKDTHAELEESKAQLDQAYEKANTEFIEKKLKEYEEANLNHRHHLAWGIINDVSGRKVSRSGRLKGSTKEERINNWHEHFQKLLGNPPEVTNEDEIIPVVFDELPIRTDAFDMDEYLKAKNSIKEGKSFGEDGIPPEVIKRCSIDDIVLDYCNKALLNRQKPNQWSILNLIPVPKSGDLSLTANYRGISLSSIIAKTYNRMLLNRIRPHLDDKLRANQCGFRERRSTTEQILALRRIIEGIKDKHLPAVITFIDFKKAFDTIHRGKMIQILKAYGIPDIIAHAIEDTYQGTKAKVITSDGDTDEFDILAGVLQGDTLAPYLFIIVLDYCLRSAISGEEERLGFTITPRKSRRVGPLNMTDLDFADDIALLSDTATQAQELLNKVEDAALCVGLHMNAKKTQFMAYNQPSCVSIKTVDGNSLEEVHDFKYLGAWVQSSDQDIKVRKAMAWKASNKLNSIWKSNLPRPLKIKLFQATVESVLLYGCETWTITKKNRKALDGCYTRMLRAALNVSWKQHMTNKELYGDIPHVTSKITTRRLTFAGHCKRAKGSPVSKLVTWQPTQGKRTRGRPMKTYVDLLQDDTGYQTKEIETSMQDRRFWRAIISARQQESTE